MEGAGSEYLELRNRRIKKLQLSVVAGRRFHGRKARVAAAAAAAAAQEEAKAPFGEKMLELEATERNTNEMISTLGSTTGTNHSSNNQAQALVPTILISREWNFAAARHQQQQAFIEKYNFDPVNDCPLPGKYEWVKLD